jgi:hypothetical protein
MRLRWLIVVTVLVGCSSEVYVRDGVTDGDTFYLAPVATVDTDPALQSWVAYSLARSVCQLELGGDNPARQNSYDCELGARNVLVDAWAEYRAGDTGTGDAYLDELLTVRQAGYLDEYTAYYLGRRDWQVPDSLDSEAFAEWRRKHLGRHRPQTRIVGYWGYPQRALD